MILIVTSLLAIINHFLHPPKLVYYTNIGLS